MRRQAVFLLLCLSCLTAFAADPVDTRTAPAAVSDSEKDFRALDRNGDGFLSRDELESSKVLAVRFDAADKNRDGRLDLAEFQNLEADASSDRVAGSAPSEAEPIERTGRETARARR